MSVPMEKIRLAETAIDEMTKLCYELGGKRYLYGRHNLTVEQVVAHYSKEVIFKWNTLKKKLDPNHLLNLDVIEHLDRDLFK